MGLEVGILSVSWSIDLYLLFQAYDECKSRKDYIKECMLAPGDISFFKSTDVYTNLDNNTWKNNKINRLYHNSKLCKFVLVY